MTGQAGDGTWGRISVWNSPTLLALEKTVDRSTTNAGSTLKYRLKVRNPTPTSQSFILDDPIFNGLAIALIFGILVSTLLTLVVIPLLYFIYLQRKGIRA